MRNKESMNNLYLCIIVAIIIAIDVELADYFSQKLNYQFSNVLFGDILIVLITGYLGKYMAAKNGFPLWWKQDKEISLIKRLVILFILGMVVIVSNSLTYYHNDNIIMVIPWLNFSSLKEPIYISLRAGLQEEVIYRLFIFTLSAFILKKFVSSERVPIIVGIIVSAVLFGVFHTGFYFAFIIGLILGYIYYSFGLIPVILIHFLADAIPFTLLFFRQNM